MVPSAVGQVVAAAPATTAASWPTPDQVDTLVGDAAHMASLDRKHVQVVASPYRICPLGAHIDHQFSMPPSSSNQGGPVTALALNCGVLLAFTPSAGSQVHLRSRQFAGDVKFSISDDVKALPALEDEQWGKFARGATYALKRRKHTLTQGIVGVLEGSAAFASSGLSSSAAVGLACLLALEEANCLNISASENIELDRLIENDFLGLKNGILDQSAIMLSRNSLLTLMNCRDRSHRLVMPGALWHQSHASVRVLQGCEPPPEHSSCTSPLYGNHDQKSKDCQPAEIYSTSPENGEWESTYIFLLAFSGLQQALTSTSGYNRRVEECQEAAQILLRAAGKQSVDAQLCHVSHEEYSTFKNLLDGGPGRRAKHFFTEAARVHQGVEAWETGDMRAFGRLMSLSGQSSIDNYECGCAPLVDLRSILLRAPGVLGARFNGAGFRGCCIALCERESAAACAAFVQEEYTALQPDLVKNLKGLPCVVACQSADGARILQ
eukprot:SM000018S03651  [mRNA]  locus=s18:530191:534171:- [translate_table: standard]